MWTDSMTFHIWCDYYYIWSARNTFHCDWKIFKSVHVWTFSRVRETWPFWPYTNPLPSSRSILCSLYIIFHSLPAEATTANSKLIHKIPLFINNSVWIFAIVSGRPMLRLEDSIQWTIGTCRGAKAPTERMWDEGKEVWIRQTTLPAHKNGIR